MREPASAVFSSSARSMSSAELSIGGSDAARGRRSLQLVLAVVDPVEARGRPLLDVAGLEEEPDLALGGGRRVRAVDEVVGARGAEIAADRSGLGVGTEGRAH